jgi:hypothetical protein
LGWGNESFLNFYAKLDTGLEEASDSEGPNAKCEAEQENQLPNAKPSKRKPGEA